VGPGGSAPFGAMARLKAGIDAARGDGLASYSSQPSEREAAGALNVQTRRSADERIAMLRAKFDEAKKKYEEGSNAYRQAEQFPSLHRHRSRSRDKSRRSKNGSLLEEARTETRSRCPESSFGLRRGVDVLRALLSG
jgi:hypothetical protein